MTDRVLTGDALYCQRQLCEQVVGEGGDYLLIVKSNQKGLYEDLELCFDRPVARTDICICSDRGQAWRPSGTSQAVSYRHTEDISGLARTPAGDEGGVLA